MILSAEAGLAPIPGPPTKTAGSTWFRVSPESRFFDGHFEGRPILPGVAHVALAVAACARWSGVERVLTALRDVRFSRPLRPGDEVEVVVTAATETSSVRFEIRCQGERATVGLLVFAPDEDVASLRE